MSKEMWMLVIILIIVAVLELQELGLVPKR